MSASRSPASGDRPRASGDRPKAAARRRPPPDLRGTIIDAIPDPILLLDGNLVVLSANRAAADARSMPIGRLIGSRCHDLHMHPEPCPRCPVARALKTGRQQESEVEFPDGKTWFIRGYPVRDGGGRVTGVVEFARDITAEKRAERGVAESMKKLERSIERTFHTIDLMVEMKDPFIVGHQEGVAAIACGIAGKLGLPEKEIRDLRTAAHLHDIGKIHVPGEILGKPGKLNEVEYQVVRSHVQVGYDVLKKIEFSPEIERIVLQHHERMDGSGYPLGLKGDAIDFGARILAVADVVEAIIRQRHYREGHGVEHARAEIVRNRGRLYDGRVVDACIRLLEDADFVLDPAGAEGSPG